MADTDNLNINIGATTDKFNQAVEQVKGKLGELQQSVNDLSGFFGAFATEMAKAFSIAAMIEFISKMGELGNQMENLMAQLGASAESAVALSGIARMTGVSVEGMANAIEHFSLNVQRSTRDAVNPQADALRVLGLRAKDLIGIKDAADYVDKLRSSVSQFNPSLNLSNALVTVGGQTFRQMIPYLRMSDEEWGKFKDRLKESNGDLANIVPRLAQTHTEIGFFSLSIRSAAAEFFDKFQPAVNGGIRALDNFVINLRNMTREGGALEGLMNVLTFAFRLFASAVTGAIFGILGFGVAVEGLFKLAAGNVEDFEKNAKVTATAIEKIGSDLKERLKEIWSAPVPITITPPGLDARAINENLRRQMAERLRIIQLEYQLEKDQIEKSYGDFVFSEAAKTQALIKNLDDRLEKEIKAGEKRILAEAKYNLERQKIIDAANKVYEQSLNEVFQGFQSAFNGQLRGLLAGTTKFKDAFKHIVGDMIIFFIQEAEKMAFKWLAHELIMTSATEAGVATRTSSEVAASATSMAAQAGKAIGSILTSAATTFAGVFAFLSPLMGPAAGAPAAASEAIVAAQAAAVVGGGLAVGTDYVARTGFTMIHQGEAVVPAEANKGFTGDHWKGGQQVTLNINAVDARSFAQMLNSNPGVFNRLIAKSMRDHRMPSMALASGIVR